MKLTEYAQFILPRPLIERAVAVLDGLGIDKGPLYLLTAELRAGLNRDRQREAIAKIERVVGPLGPGDLLDEVAAALSSADQVERLRATVRSAEPAELWRIADDLGFEMMAFEDYIGGEFEELRRSVLRRLGDRATPS